MDWAWLMTPLIILAFAVLAYALTGTPIIKIDRRTINNYDGRKKDG